MAARSHIVQMYRLQQRNNTKRQHASPGCKTRGTKDVEAEMVVVSIQKMGDEGFERIEVVGQQVPWVQVTVGNGSKGYLVLGSIAYMYPVLYVYVKDEVGWERWSTGWLQVFYTNGLGQVYIYTFFLVKLENCCGAVSF